MKRTQTTDPRNVKKFRCLPKRVKGSRRGEGATMTRTYQTVNRFFRVLAPLEVETAHAIIVQHDGRKKAT